jgi:hypothetical protein
MLLPTMGLFTVVVYNTREKSTEKKKSKEEEASIKL